MARASVKMEARLPLHGHIMRSLSQLCCNPSLLFNKQFVSDALNGGSDSIVRETCRRRLLSLSLALLLSGVCVCARTPARAGGTGGGEDGGAILKGLQLHLNGIIGHDGWLLPFHSV